MVGRSGHPAAIFDIATTADLWLADSPKSPTKMTSIERADLVELMVDHGKQSNPAALFRLGCCFWHGEILNMDTTAALKCWHNAHELLDAHFGGIFGLIHTQAEDRLAIRLMDQCARRIRAAHDHLLIEGVAPVDKLKSGELFDLSDLFDD